MTPLLSPYKEVKCPDGQPRLILKEPEKAFSILVPDWDARVNALVKFLEKIQTGVDVEIKKRTGSIIKELTENYATLQANYQAVYLIYAANPCDKESEEKCRKAMEDIRNKSFVLNKLETKAKNISRLRAVAKVRGAHADVCPVCGAPILKKPKRSWKMAGRPGKAGKRMQLEIGLYKCQKGHTFRKILQKGSIELRGSRETNTSLSKQMGEVEKLVSTLKT